ncbi:MAG: hypothetical protein AC479_02165 [miscellaneous Crenarchaeota group-6 archaeon AD8-1]|nr:MAG: hypothetical protein AC479_02165 [miscellaneous Crenarchaeota group-6 archaeon AD8-1]
MGVVGFAVLSSWMLGWWLGMNLMITVIRSLVLMIILGKSLEWPGKSFCVIAVFEHSRFFSQL